MAEESQWSRERRILGNIVFALPRAVRWLGQNFLNGVRAGMANAKREQDRRDGR
jgi:hypothetical protein